MTRISNACLLPTGFDRSYCPVNGLFSRNSKPYQEGGSMRRSPIDWRCVYMGVGHKESSDVVRNAGEGFAIHVDRYSATC